MGDCTSRPTKEDIEFHQKPVWRHDTKFYRRPDLPYLKEIVDERIVNADQQERYKKYDQQLQADIKYLNNLKDSKHKHLPKAHPYIAIEVCKAVNLYPDISCLQAARPIVKVTALPVFCWVQTTPGEQMIPSWNQYFEIETENSAFDNLTFTVLMERRIGGLFEYGKVVIPFEQLRDQEVKSGWFDIEGPAAAPEGKPQLLLKCQFISDLSALLESHRALCEATLAEALKAFSLCKRLLNQVIADVGPEGRGDIIK
jgi:hypothetical protein